MRELMNGVSRWMEYDLRNDLFIHLETLDSAYFAHTRTGDIMARLTNDLGAVRMALGPKRAPGRWLTASSNGAPTIATSGRRSRSAAASVRTGSF